MCPPMCKHWHHLANITELVLPSVHPSPQPKWQINQFSHFCTAHSRKSLNFTMGDPFPQNCPFSWGIWTPTNSIPSAILSPQSKQHHDRFSHFRSGDRRVSLYFTMGCPFPQKLPLPMKGFGTSSNTIPWAHLSPQPKQHLNRFSRFCTDDCSVSLYFTMGRPFLPQNCPFPWGDLDSHLIQT